MRTSTKIRNLAVGTWIHRQWVPTDTSLQGIVLGAILVLSCALSLYRLGAQSLWIDEVTSLLVARLSPMQIISERATSVNGQLARRLTELYGSPTHTAFVRIDIFCFEAARQ